MLSWGQKIQSIALTSCLTNTKGWMHLRCVDMSKDGRIARLQDRAATMRVAQSRQSHQVRSDFRFYFAANRRDTPLIL